MFISDNQLLIHNRQQGAHSLVTEQRKSRLIQELRRKRDAVNGDLPTYDSIIGILLFLVFCEYEISGQPARLKDVYLEVDRSQGGVRRILRRLAADGWIEISRSKGDQRNRFVTPTPKFKRKIGEYLQTLVA